MEDGEPAGGHRFEENWSRRVGEPVERGLSRSDWSLRVEDRRGHLFDAPLPFRIVSLAGDETDKTARIVPNPVDRSPGIFHNYAMSTGTIISAELLDEIQHRLENAAKGIRDAEEMKKACEHMDRTREELRQRIGTIDVAVDLIRDARNQ